VSSHGRNRIAHVGYYARASYCLQDLVAFLLLLPLVHERRRQDHKLLPHGPAELREGSGRLLKDENYAEALRYFTYVKQKSPSRSTRPWPSWQRQTPEFDRGSYQEAIDAYKSFLRLHPKHEKVAEGYVSFRIAEAHVKQMPMTGFSSHRPTRRTRPR